MTKTEGKTASAAVKDILLSNPDGLHEVIRAVMQEVLEAEMDEALGASKGERTPERLGYAETHPDEYVPTAFPSFATSRRASRRLLSTAVQLRRHACFSTFPAEHGHPTRYSRYGTRIMTLVQS